MRSRFSWFRALGSVVMVVAPAFGQTDAARTERVLAAVETFEGKFRALESLAASGELAGELMEVFARELPAPIASNLSSGIADFVNQYGGLEAFAALMERGPEHYRASLPTVLSADRQNLLTFRQAIAKKTDRAPDDWPKRMATWAPAPRGKRGPTLATDNLDLRSVRIRAVLQGAYGALFDLGIASALGLDTPVDGDLIGFWGALGIRTDRAQALKINNQPPDSAEYFRAAAEAGSAWGMTRLALKFLPEDMTPIPPGEARALLEKAAALGFTASASYLKWRGLADSPSVGSVAAAAIAAQPQAPAAASATPEQTAVAALVQLDHALLTSPSYEAVEKRAIAVVKALDQLPDKRAADAVAMATLEFLRRHGGAQDYFAFQMALSGEHFAAAQKFSVAKLSPAQKATVRALAGQTVRKTTGATVPPVDASLWRASHNPLPDLKTDDQLDLEKVRLAFVKGATGAAMDLEVAYKFGSGARRHAGAAAFWCAAVEHLALGLEAAGSTPLKALRAVADLGSAFARSDLADELQRQNGGKPNDEIVALRRRAEAGGLRAEEVPPAPAALSAPAPAEIISARRLLRPLIARVPKAQAALDRPEYRLPIESLDREEQAHAAVMAGVAAAIKEGEAATLVAHLTGWMRVRRAAEELAGKNPSSKLPARDLQQHLLSFVEPARKAGQFGTVFLLRMAMDRELWWQGKAIAEKEIVRTDELGWLHWRLGALISLPWIMLVASDGDLLASGPAIPPWAPVLRHPVELLDRHFVPLLNVPPERLASSDLKSLNTFYRRDPTAVLLTIHPPGSERAPEIVAARTRSVTQRVPAVNRNYEREVAERDAALVATLAAINAKLAELDKKIAAVQPVVESRTKKRVLVATERKATYRTRTINENGPGTRQGDQVFTGFIDVPTYREVEEVQRSPDWNHPLYVEKRKLEAERKSPPQKPAPSRLLATGTDAIATHYDRWTATPIVAVTLKENGAERTVRLHVPMTYELTRPFGHAVANVALGSAGLRRMVAHPANLGAAAVHRAVAAFLLEERLTATLGERRASTEAALIRELLFGFEPDDGTVLQALREIGRPAAAK